MALKITDDCINCDACVAECPNSAIYEPEDDWNYEYGTGLVGMVANMQGQKIDASKNRKALSDEFYFIIEDKCTECKGFHEVPQCVESCPVDCIIIDTDLDEKEDFLLKKKDWLHPK